MITADAFLADAHRNGHRGAVMLRRWAIIVNQDRRHPSRFITEATLAEAIQKEEENARKGVSGKRD